jgi:hypothetical protein
VNKVDCFIFDCDGKCKAISPTSDDTSCLSDEPGRMLIGTAIITPILYSYGLGVIWRGDSVIEGVPETLEMLRSMVSIQGGAARARAGGLQLTHFCYRIGSHTSSVTGSQGLI